MGAERGDFAGAKAAAQKARSEDPEAFYQAAHYEPNGQRRFLDEKQTQAVSYEVSKSRVAKSTLSGASDYADARGLYAVRDEIDDFARALEAGKPPQRLSVEAADYIERSINQRYKSARSGATQDIPAGIKSLRDRMRGIIDTTGLGKARETAAEAIRRGELLDEGRKFMKTDVDVEDINNTLRGNPELDIDPASPAGQQAYTVGAARAIADKLRDTQNMKGFADATRAVARTPAIREKISAVLPQKLTKKGVPSKAARQTRLNNELDEAIERTADRADFTNTMLGNSRTAFRQGAVDDALADDHISSAVGEGVRDLLMGGPGNVFQQAAGKFAKGVGARIGQPGIMRPGLNRKMADILLATDKDIPVQLARLARRAAQRGMARVTMRGLPPPPAGSGPSTPPTAPRTPPTPPAGGSPAGPIKASGFAAPQGSGKRPVGFLDDLERGSETFHDPRLGPVGSDKNKAVEMARNGYSNAEIAEAIGYTEGTVSKTLSQARAIGIDVPTGMSAGGATATETGTLADILRLKEKGYTNAQIAAATGKGDNSIKVMLSKHRRALADAGKEIPSWLAPARANGLGAVGRDAAGGAFGGAILPMPSTGDPEEDMKRRLMLMGTMAVGAGAGPRLARQLASGRRTVGAPRVAGSGLFGKGKPRTDLDVPRQPVGDEVAPSTPELNTSTGVGTRGQIKSPYVEDDFYGKGIVGMESPSGEYIQTLERLKARLAVDAGDGFDELHDAQVIMQRMIRQERGYFGSRLPPPAEEAEIAAEAARRVMSDIRANDIVPRAQAPRVTGQGLPKTPAQAAKFETPGSPEWEAAKAKGLDMSQAGRDARRREMGFGDKIYYHGTDADFNAFDAEKSLDGLGIHVGTSGQANTVEATRIASSSPIYKTGSKVLPLYVRVKNPLRLPDLEDWMPSSIIQELRSMGILVRGKQTPENIVNTLKRQGYDGIVYKNMFEGKGQEDSLIVFDPSNIRSVNAAFDPDKAASPILTAGFPGGRRGRPPGSPTQQELPKAPAQIERQTGRPSIPPSEQTPGWYRRAWGADKSARNGSSWRDPEASPTASATAVRIGQMVAKMRPRINVVEAAATPGRMVASGMRALDRRLRAPEDPRMLAPVIAGGGMRIPPSGNVPTTRPSIERMKNPGASADVLAGVQRRAERAYGAEKGEGIIPGRTERVLDTLKKIEQYATSLSQRIDDMRGQGLNSAELKEALAARADISVAYGDAWRRVLAARKSGDPAALRAAEAELAKTKAVWEAMKKAPGQPRGLAQLEQIDAELTRAMQDTRSKAGVFGVSGRQIRRDNEIADLLTNPARAPDAAKVAQSKPLGSHELKGQLAVWGGVGAAGAGLYAASENEKRKQSEDYYAKRAAFDYENKDVPGITGERLEEIQRFLNYVAPGEKPLTDDGKMGPATSEAIKRYQKMRGLKVNGRRTWQTIEDIEREMSGEAEPKKAQAR
jgi:hypothetical protein